MKVPRILVGTVVLLFALIVLLPVFYMIAAPFWGGNTVHWENPPRFIDSRQLHLARNSLLLASGATALCLAMGVPLAFLIARTEFWGRKLLGVIYLLPVLIPPYVHAIVWMRLEQAVRPFFDLQVHGLGGAMWVLAMAYYPFVTLMTLSGLNSVDRSLEEASLLQRGKWLTLSRVTLPLSSPHIVSGAIFVCVFSIMDFAVPDMLRVQTYPVEIFVQFSAFYDEGAAVLLSLPLVAVASLLMMLQRWVMKDRSYVSPSSGRSGVLRLDPAGLEVPLFGFCLLLVTLSGLVPMLVLFYIAGHWSKILPIGLTSLGSMAYSLMLAALGALATVLLAFPISYLLWRSRGKISSLLSLAVFIPFMVPATTFGIGLIRVWNRPLAELVYGSSLIIVLGYTARFLPFAAVAIHSGLKQISPSLEEVACLAVPGWGRRVRKILLPLLRPSLVGSFFVVFVLSLGEIGTTLLVIPPGRETIPIRIYNLMHYGADQMVAGLCLIMMGLIFIVAMCLSVALPGRFPGKLRKRQELRGQGLE